MAIYTSDINLMKIDDLHENTLDNMGDNYWDKNDDRKLCNVIKEMKQPFYKVFYYLEKGWETPYNEEELTELKTAFTKLKELEDVSAWMCDFYAEYHRTDRNYEQALFFAVLAS